MEPVKVELGGGRFPRGDGFINLDLIDQADIRIDLERVGRGEIPLPFTDDSVGEVYSSHCFEHVYPYRGVLREIARICRPGARVELRVPHWGSSMALCTGHKHTICEQQVAHWSEFPDVWWGESLKHLALLETHYVPSRHFAEAQTLFRRFSPEQIYRFVPNTCHEIRFLFEVRRNAPT